MRKLLRDQEAKEDWRTPEKKEFCEKMSTLAMAEGIFVSRPRMYDIPSYVILCAN